MSDVMQAPAPAGKYLVDTYENWAKGEGIPIVAGMSVDLLAVETAPWPRFACNGAFCHLEGRDDFLSLAVIELAPGAASAPQHHLFEALCYVLTGSGSTEIELGTGERRRLEWGPKSLVAVPMNARYRHRNSGSAPARLALVSDLRYLLNLYRSERFLFATEMRFPEREATSPADCARDLGGAEVSGGRLPLALAGGALGADLVALAPATYKPARRQMQGTHLFGVEGDGYMLSWRAGEEELSRIDWRHGMALAAPSMSFQQHFNARQAPARYLEIQLGSVAHPMFRSRRAAYGDDTVYAAGQVEIPIAEEDPRIAAQFERERAKAR